MTKEKTLKELLLPIVKKCYKDNFEGEGIWGHYIIPFENQTDKDFYEAVVGELIHNGIVEARRHYLKIVRKQLEKNKSTSQWESWAKDFLTGFDKEGNIILKKKNDK